MPPILALLLTFALIAWLFRIDREGRGSISGAVWICIIWCAIIGSRAPVHWLSLIGLGGWGATDAEGSIGNSVVFGILMLSAVVVLVRRQYAWATFFRSNSALVALYVFFALSTLWADNTGVSFKRLLKDFGSVLVALVLLTEQDPGAAIRCVFTRVGCVLFPLSIVFNKYFPEIGRNYSISGAPMMTGVSTQKNSLGLLVLVVGTFMIYDLMMSRRAEPSQVGKRLQRMQAGVLALGIWVLVWCDSKTSLACLVLSAILIWWTGRVVRAPNPRGSLVFAGCMASLLFVLDLTLKLSDRVIEALGRDSTLTGRTEIWKTLIAQPINAFVGCGFQGFWDGALGQAVIEQMRTLKTAHNGYIEIYLDGGLVAVVLLAILLIQSVVRSVHQMVRDGSELSRVGFVVVISAVVYNISESSFFMLMSPLWFAFLLMSIRGNQVASQQALVHCPAVGGE